MLWIALHLPQLPLDTALRCRLRHPFDCGYASISPQHDSLSDTPVAICERKLVGWCNQLAEDAGIRPGMSESSARALTGKLQTFSRDLEQEAQALQEAALWSLRFTPHVVLRPSGLLMEVAASLRLFKGPQRIASELLSGLMELGLHARLASAPTASGAWLRAQSGHINKVFIPPDQADAALDALPLSVLDSAQAHLDTLTGIGCRTVGQLRQLPRAGVTRRFGKEVLRELDRAYGDETEAHQWFEAPIVFDARLELPARVENTEALLFATRRLLLQLSGWLSARHAAVASITLCLHHESTRQRDHRSTPLTIVLGMPSRDIDHLTLLLRERLAQLDLIAPVVEIGLKADQIAEQAAPNTELFPTPASDAESTGRLIERLQSRLGNEAVRQISMFADHRPEKSSVTSAINGQQKARRSNRQDQLAPHSACARPTWLLQKPLALITRQHKPFYQSPLTLLTGPERIETGWWDDGLATRDYFIAQNDSHLLLWIFRQRTMNKTTGSGWFLHGFFG
jgi:protein ImuB